MHLSGKFAELAALEEGWDSYGGKRIDLGCLQRAQEMFYSLRGQWAIVPTSPGGVQLELHADGLDIEILIERAPTGDRDG